jgi:hypothetical protein
MTNLKLPKKQLLLERRTQQLGREISERERTEKLRAIEQA